MHAPIAKAHAFMLFSIKNAVMPCAPPSGCVFAYTTSVSAIVPFVHHILVPLSTNTPLRASARQRMPTTSDPAPGSLIASAPTCSPAVEGNCRLVMGA